MKKHPHNPILTAADVPYEASLIFNAGVAKYQDRYVMVFRNDYGFTPDGTSKSHGTNIGLAFSDDGVSWSAASRPWFEMQDDEISRAYDPRITVIEDKAYLCFAVDTKHGLRGGILSSEDYTLDGFRGSVIFPGGMILEDTGEVKIYYGAADTVEAMAIADVNDLLALYEPVE